MNYYVQFHYKENEISDFSQYIQVNITTVYLHHTTIPVRHYFPINYSLISVSVGVTDRVTEQAVSHVCPTAARFEPTSCVIRPAPTF